MSAQRKIGLVLFMLGIGIAVGLIGFQIMHTADIWINDLEGKRDTFVSFSDYFFSTSKGAILIGLISGTIPALIGAALLIKKE